MAPRDECARAPPARTRSLPCSPACTISDARACVSFCKTDEWFWTGTRPDAVAADACIPTPFTTCPALLADVEVCPDGLAIPGPAVTPANSLAQLSILFWLFYGVSIGADLFMEAIETITSQEVQTQVAMPGGGKRRPLTVRVWNATIANLTLMALGSSAPEILLSVIEIVGNSFYSGELGPSTIVGSAAFNLMVISAVCVTAIPNGEGRLIKHQSVFAITAFFSVFAYLWLALILIYSTPNVIDLWEGLLTLAFFPILVWLSYLADIGKLTGTSIAKCLGCGGSSGGKVGGESIVNVIGGRKVEVIGVTASMQSVQNHSKAYYRMNATKVATGQVSLAEREENADKKLASYMSSTTASKARKEQSTGQAASIELGASHFSVREKDGWANVDVFRGGSLAAIASVGYKITLGPAAGDAAREASGDLADAIVAEGRIHFDPTQQRSTLRIQLLHDDVKQSKQVPRDASPGSVASPGGVASFGDVAFVVQLDAPSQGASLGGLTRCDVKVIGGDAPGVLCLEDDEIIVSESQGVATLVLKREDGTKGEVSCVVSTKDGKAVSPADYDGLENEVVTFKDGEVRKAIKINVKDDNHYEVRVCKPRAQPSLLHAHSHPSDSTPLKRSHLMPFPPPLSLPPCRVLRISL